MKYLIRKRTKYLHDYVVVENTASLEFKQRIFAENFKDAPYMEVDESEMYPFGVLKSEYNEYKASDEYIPSTDSTLLPGEIRI